MKKKKKLSIGSHRIPSYRIMHCALYVIYLSVSMMMIMTTIVSHALVVFQNIQFELDGSFFFRLSTCIMLSYHTFTSYDCAVEHFYIACEQIILYELLLCTIHSILLATKRSDESKQKKKTKNFQDCTYVDGFRIFHCA